jgi:putative ATP-dependent endonuclease of OLD family
MQRSLVKYLNRIINNESSDFQLLIKELFGIDKFFGQIIIATHSPSIILNDFKQIIRLYSKNGHTEIISGNNLVLGEQLEKHLFLHFPFIKEAFFSRCAIFVEGDSEFGSFPFFAEKCNIDFDDYGISVIQAGGDSVLQLIQLSDKFGIPCVGIKDSDGDNSPTGVVNLFKTNARDFEAELMFLIDNGKESKLYDIVVEYDSLGAERELEPRAINKRAHQKYGYLAAPISVKLKLSQIAKTDTIHLKSYYSTWFSINKSQPLGRLIGLNLSEEDIPQIYKQVITIAKSLS